MDQQCRRCNVEALMDDTKVMNLYTPESNFRKTISKYNAAAKTQSVSAIRGYQRWLGGAQDDREEREQLQQAIASTKEVRAHCLLSRMHPWHHKGKEWLGLAMLHSNTWLGLSARALNNAFLSRDEEWCGTPGCGQHQD